MDRIRPSGTVLELGCGYGRILPALASRARFAAGIDTSMSSLLLGRQTILRPYANCHLVQAHALFLPFPDSSFDVVLCLQNGISAFHVDQLRLLRESLRVIGSGGTAIFTSYSEKIWDQRLEWFYRQADEGLIGAIDPDRTRNGVIVCGDGFTATTVGLDRFLSLTNTLGIRAGIHEVDDSFIACEFGKAG